jgi:hypothetical protein
MSPRISSSALLVALAASSCTRDEPVKKSTQPQGDVTVAMWDFPEDPAAAAVSLWPPRTGTPRRSKRHLATRDSNDRLEAVVEGADPFFMWRFETPIAAWSVGVQVDLAAPGPLQLFWSTARCPVFSEPCSTTRSLPAGPAHVTFFLDGADPVRELRLDLPDRVGARLAFDAITVRQDARVGSPWIAQGDEAPQPELTPSGLRLEAREPDPWLMTSLQELDTSRVSSVELTLRGPSGPPQLYWDAACGPQGFSEECSARFSPVDAGALTHRLDLRGVPRWRGRIGVLRLDPGPEAGTYLIERIALVKAAPP